MRALLGRRDRVGVGLTETHQLKIIKSKEWKSNMNGTARTLLKARKALVGAANQAPSEFRQAVEGARTSLTLLGGIENGEDVPDRDPLATPPAMQRSKEEAEELSILAYAVAGVAALKAGKPKAAQEYFTKTRSETINRARGGFGHDDFLDVASAASDLAVALALQGKTDEAEALVKGARYSAARAYRPQAFLLAGLDANYAVSLVGVGEV